MAVCKTCGSSFTWKEVEPGKWVPYNGEQPHRHGTRTEARLAGGSVDLHYISPDQWSELTDSLGRIEMHLSNIAEHLLLQRQGK